MKELIESLNLPKQIIDKTEKLISVLFGEGFKEIGSMFGDRMRLKRLKNQIDIFNEASKIMEANGLTPHQINLKTLVPLLEKSSLEEDENLQKNWANLIANIASTKINGIEPKLIETLSSLSSIEVAILDFLYESFLEKRTQKFKESSSRKYSSYKNIEDVKPDRILFTSSIVKNKFVLTNEFTIIYLENLQSIGLLRNADPDIEIEDNFSEAEIVEQKNNEPSIDLNLNISANYSRSEDFHFTAYGIYFVQQCKGN